MIGWWFYADRDPDRRRRVAARRVSRRSSKSIWSLNWSKRTAWQKNSCEKYRIRRLKHPWRPITRHHPCHPNGKHIRLGELKGRYITLYLTSHSVYYVSLEWKKITVYIVFCFLPSTYLYYVHYYISTLTKSFIARWLSIEII